MPLGLFDLLERGYFPKELPPPFSTTSFASAVAGPHIHSPIEQFENGHKHSMLCQHNLVRAGGLRRNLGIPNPIHYYQLAYHIVKNWTKLKSLIDESPYSVSQSAATGSDRAISPEHDPEERKVIHARRRATSRFVLKADISRFYPSIYTHSLPWAILGKKEAKEAHAHGKLKGNWYDYIDVYSRNINNKQTIGIPIGPDTSRILSEVLLSRLDLALAKKYPTINGLRYIDDFKFFLPSRAQAEKILSYLQQLLNDYELALNPGKTGIIELPDYFDNPGISKMRDFLFRDAKKGQKNDLTAYFDMVFDLSKRYPKQSIFQYAISRLQSVEILNDNWELFESILIHCVTIEPACLPQICQRLSYYSSKEFPIDSGRWSDCLNRIVQERVPLGQSSEAAWSMWLMKLLNIKLSERAAKVVGDCEDSIVSLMALGLGTIGLSDYNKRLSGLYRFRQKSCLYEYQWLLCYQGNLMSLLGDKSGPKNLFQDRAFSFLASQDVSFFDINTSPPTPTRYPTPEPYWG